MSDLDNLGKLTVPEINARLKAFGCRPSSIPSKEKKLEALKLFIIREQNHPFNPVLECVISDEELLEQQKIFAGHDKNLWQNVYNLKHTEVPKGFKRDIITAFLRESQLLVNGTLVKNSTKKPKVKGWDLYMSRKIISCKFLKTPLVLLLDAQMYGSYSQERR